MHRVCGGRASFRLTYSAAALLAICFKPAILSAQPAGQSIELASGAPSGSGDLITDFRSSPNSRFVIFRRGNSGGTWGDLYSVPRAGGTPTRLSGGPDPDQENLAFFRLTVPNSSQVIFLSDQLSFSGQQELFSVSIQGPATGAVRLAGASTSSYMSTADSARILYRLNTGTRQLLYSVPAVGPQIGIPLHPNPPSGGQVDIDFQITPDTARVIYTGDLETDGVRELFSSPVAGPADQAVKLNSTLIENGVVEFFKVSPDGSRVVYKADQDMDEVDELYSVPIDGSAPAQKLSGELTAGGDIDFGIAFWISPDSTRVIYRADQEVDGYFEIYSVPMDGSQAPVKISGGLFSRGISPLFTPNGDTVVFTAAMSPSLSDHDLYATPTDGADPPTRLNEPLFVAGSTVSEMKLSAQADRVLYIAQQDSNSADLHSVPIVGPASAGVRLNGELVEGGVIEEFLVAANDQRVVYLAQQDSTQFEVYSAPLDGLTPAVRISPEPDAPDGRAEGILLADSGRIAVFTMRDNNARRDLYKALTDGSSPAERVHGPVVAGGEVEPPQLMPDDQTLVYLSDDLNVNIHSLFLHLLVQSTIFSNGFETED